MASVEGCKGDVAGPPLAAPAVAVEDLCEVEAEAAGGL